MADQLRVPEDRTCEQCGRVEHWDDEAGVWRAAEPGTVSCIHEWDIDGGFVPIAEE